jgi:hypothetical protein
MNRAKLFCFVLLFVPAVAVADDFAPPPWLRSDPFAVTAEFEFLTPANPAPADGALTNVYTKGTGTPPGPFGGTFVDIAGGAWGGTSGGNWFFPGPGEMHFRINNVVDFRPLKFLHVQVTSTPGMFLLMDPMAGFNVGATGSVPGPVTMTSFGVVTGPFGPVEHTLITWNMFPNPPWEDFTLRIGGPGEIRQVVVDTLSAVPEVSTIVSYALIFGMLGVIVWKRPEFWRLALG